MSKTLTLTNQQDEFLQNVLQNWVNLGEPKSSTELTLATEALQAMREPSAPPVTLDGTHLEFLQRILLDFQFQTNLTVNSSRVQEGIVNDLMALLREP